MYFFYIKCQNLNDTLDRFDIDLILDISMEDFYFNGKFSYNDLKLFLADEINKRTGIVRERKLTIQTINKL